LDQIITRWTVVRDAFQAAEELQGIGVPSAAVLRGPDLLEDPHYTDRGTFVTVDHPQVGPRRYPGMPWKMSATPVRVRWASPTLGQHNHQIYGELLGMPQEEIAALEALEVIGTKPIGSRLMG
jgi:crotonobetainyl-CoA:carnitine CoA-transferase CaiB-like acyl-CoA transferase